MGGATSSVRTNITLAQHTSTVDTTVISQYKFKNGKHEERHPELALALSLRDAHALSAVAHTSVVSVRFLHERSFVPYCLFPLFPDDTPSHFKTKHLKVVIVGAPRVGKSSIVRRWLHNTFDADLSSYIPTTKVDISLKLITFNDSTLRVEVWDTPSHPEIRDMYVCIAHAIYVACAEHRHTYSLHYLRTRPVHSFT